jgi:hypothetical protein
MTEQMMKANRLPLWSDNPAMNAGAIACAIIYVVTEIVMREDETFS